MQNKKILVTGATGNVARTIVAKFASDNEVWGAARFSSPEARADLESQGVSTFKWSLGSADFDGLPDDFDYVVHAAASIFETANDYDDAVRRNAEGAGLLMNHVRNAAGFLFISSQHIYTQIPDTSIQRKETDDLGCHPSYAPSYSISKVAAEAVVRTLARVHNIPTTIARLGTNYGVGVTGVLDYGLQAMIAGETMVVPPRGKAICALIHNGTLRNQVEPLLRAASVPATIVNWTADENVDIRDVYDYMAELAGLSPKYVESADATPLGGAADPTKRIAITGPDPTDWRTNVREMLAKNTPHLAVTI